MEQPIRQKDQSKIKLSPTKPPIISATRSVNEETRPPTQEDLVRAAETAAKMEALRANIKEQAVNKPLELSKQQLTPADLTKDTPPGIAKENVTSEENQARASLLESPDYQRRHLMPTVIEPSFEGFGYQNIKDKDGRFWKILDEGGYATAPANDARLLTPAVINCAPVIIDTEVNGERFRTLAHVVPPTLTDLQSPVDKFLENLPDGTVVTGVQFIKNKSTDEPTIIKTTNTILSRFPDTNFRSVPIKDDTWLVDVQVIDENNTVYKANTPTELMRESKMAQAFARQKEKGKPDQAPVQPKTPNHPPVIGREPLKPTGKVLPNPSSNEQRGYQYMGDEAFKRLLRASMQSLPPNDPSLVKALVEAFYRGIDITQFSKNDPPIGTETATTPNTEKQTKPEPIPPAPRQKTDGDPKLADLKTQPVRPPESSPLTPREEAKARLRDLHNLKEKAGPGAQALQGKLITDLNKLRQSPNPEDRATAARIAEELIRNPTTRDVVKNLTRDRSPNTPPPKGQPDAQNKPADQEFRGVAEKFFKPSTHLTDEGPIDIAPQADKIKDRPPKIVQPEQQPSAREKLQEQMDATKNKIDTKIDDTLEQNPALREVVSGIEATLKQLNDIAKQAKDAGVSVAEFIKTHPKAAKIATTGAGFAGLLALGPAGWAALGIGATATGILATYRTFDENTPQGRANRAKAEPLVNVARTFGRLGGSAIKGSAKVAALVAAIAAAAAGSESAKGALGKITKPYEDELARVKGISSGSIEKTIQLISDVLNAPEIIGNKLDEKFLGPAAGSIQKAAKTYTDIEKKAGQAIGNITYRGLETIADSVDTFGKGVGRVAEGALRGAEIISEGVDTAASVTGKVVGGAAKGVGVIAGVGLRPSSKQQPPNNVSYPQSKPSSREKQPTQPPSYPANPEPSDGENQGQGEKKPQTPKQSWRERVFGLKPDINRAWSGNMTPDSESSNLPQEQQSPSGSQTPDQDVGWPEDFGHSDAQTVPDQNLPDVDKSQSQRQPDAPIEREPTQVKDLGDIEVNTPPIKEEVTDEVIQITPPPMDLLTFLGKIDNAGEFISNANIEPPIEALSAAVQLARDGDMSQAQAILAGVEAQYNEVLQQEGYYANYANAPHAKMERH